MKFFLNRIFFITFYLLIVKSVHSQSGPPYCNNLVTLDGKRFMCGGELFYPVAVEYIFDVLHNVQLPTQATDYYLSRTHGYGPSTFNYESSTAADCRTEIHNDFTIIHQMGFNCIRTAGLWATFDINTYEQGWTTPPNNYHENGTFTATDFVQVCAWNSTGTWEGYGYKIPTGADPDNYRGHYFDMIKEVLEVANECSLKVILDIGVLKLIDPVNINNYKDYLSALGTFIYGLNASTPDLYNTLIAYSPVEEPAHEAAPAYTKKTICDATEQLYASLKGSDPNHLITMGTIPDKDIFLWDPGVMKFDFISLHIYPFPTLGNTNPLFEVNDDMAVEKVKSQIYWWKNICPYPWIMGETGFLANGIDHYPTPASTVLKVWGELETPISGEIYTQRKYARDILKFVRDCGGSGVSWWEFQDGGWAYFGLLKSQGEASVDYATLRKPVVSEFETYLDQYGQPPPVSIADAIRPPLYYDMANHSHFNSSTNYIHGIVKDVDTNEPIKDAIISATTLVHDGMLDGPPNNIYIYDTYISFTHEDGSFTAIPYDFWEEQNPLAPVRNTLTGLAITTAGSSRIEKGSNYWGINSGSIIDNQVYPLKRNADKQIMNLTITSGNTASYQSFISLTTKNVSIAANATADFLARKEINILPDFDAHAGSEVLIHLGDVSPDCSDYTSYARVSGNSLTDINFPDKLNSKEIILNFINKDSYSILPNPNNGIFDIKFNKISKSVNKIKLYNVFGEIDYSANTFEKELKLNLINLSKGVYFLDVDCEKVKSVKKIIIQ